MPVRRVKAQPQMWPMGTESPQWVWTIPNVSGLCTLSSSHHTPLLASPRPPTPPVRTLTSWQLSCDPFLPRLISPIPLPSIQVTHLFIYLTAAMQNTHRHVIYIHN